MGGGKPGGKPSGKPSGKEGARGSKPLGGGKQAQPKKGAPSTGPTSMSPANSPEQPLIQMSRKWIAKNIKTSGLDRFVIDDFAKFGKNVYSRHLFYTPFYLPTAAEHEKALLENEPEKHEKHANHDIPSTHRHDEQEVKAAINHKHAKLGLELET